jgi:hypothetical protein
VLTVLAGLGTSIVTARPGGDSASAATPLGLACAPYGDQTICSGEVPSFDGTTLDVDVTPPTSGTGPHPLIVMLHGFGNDKHEWESTNDEADNADKWHWNNHWFAARGYYVLNYTARGFGDDGASEPYEPTTPPGTTCPKKGSDCLPAGTIRVKNKNVEIRDTQWLAAKVAKEYSGVDGIDPAKVAVTGGSYGGGESWLQAAEPTWTFPRTIDPTLPVLQVQVAVPKYPWTDLAYSLAPSGRGPTPYTSSSGPQSSRDGDGNPFGVGKTSYIAGLYATGTTKGTFEEGTNTTPQNLPPDPETYPPTEPFTAWLGRLGAGEPYSVAPKTDDPVVGQVRHAFSHWHSAYYSPGWKAQKAAGRTTAVFTVSGWTDDLFPAVESTRMFTYLKSLDPKWPVEARFADVGHSRAQNKPGTWQRINTQAWDFLQQQIIGAHKATTKVASQVTDCTDNEFPEPAEVVATSPPGLGIGTLSVRPTRPAVLAPTSGTGDPDGVRTDAVAGNALPALSPSSHGGCTVGTTPAAPDGPFGYRAVSAPLPAPRTTVGIGTVSASYTATPGATGVVAARVWDVAPDGTPLLLSRGVYRLDFIYGDRRTGKLQLPLYGNHWQLPAGHRLRVDLQQVDTPTYRPPTGAVSSLTLTGVRLDLPVRTGGTQVLPAT